MKIIDLLNKIANGEAVPKKIRFSNTNWNRIYGEKNIYYTSDNNCDLFLYFFRENLTFTLNDEVEIIEEEKKAHTLNDIRESYGLPRIEEKKIPEKLSILQFSDLIDMSKEELIETIKEQRFKINEIIDYLKRKGK